MGAGGPKKETPSSHHYHFVQRSATSGAKQPTVQAAQTKVQDPAQKTAMTAKDTKTMTVKDTPRLLEGAAAEQRDESLLRLLKSRDGSFRTMLLMEEAEAREDEEHGHHPHPHHRHQHRKPHKAQREVQSEQKARAATSAVHPGQRQRRLSMSMNMNHLASQEDIERLASAASAAGAGAREGGPEQLQVWQGRTKPSLGTLAETVDTHWQKLSQDTAKALGGIGLLPTFVLNPGAGTGRRLAKKEMWMGGHKVGR